MPRPTLAWCEGCWPAWPIRPNPSTASAARFPADFCYYDLPRLAKADGADGLKALEILLDWSEATRLESVRPGYRLWSEKVNQLCQGHPRPYQPIDTVKRTNARWLNCIRDLDIPWTRLPKGLAADRDRLEPWPEALKSPPKHQGQDPGKVSDEKVRAAHDELLHVENPAGRVYVDVLREFSDSYQQMTRLTRARLEGTRLLLASRVFVLQQGRLPQKLDELVAAKILDSLPLDPFSVDAAEPFRYWPSRAIWFVDAEGNGSPQGLAYGHLGWSVDPQRPHLQHVDFVR